MAKQHSEMTDGERILRDWWLMQDNHRELLGWINQAVPGLANDINAVLAAKVAERDRLRGVVLALLGGDASAPRVLRPNEWARAVEDALRALRGNGREA